MENINKYWEKSKNNNSLKLPKGIIKSRIDLFRKDLKGKKVLHIGCTASPATLEQMKAGSFLHSIIKDFSSDLSGIDISSDGVKIMNNNGFSKIHVADVYTLYKNKEFLKYKFDVILISEVIEYLVNPGLALFSLEKYIQNTNPKCEIIFTVPNIHNFGFRFVSGLKNKETVNTDHKFYFSYRVFRNLIENFNFRTKEFSYVTYFKRPNSLFKRLILSIYSKVAPCLAPYLYFKCDIKK